MYVYLYRKNKKYLNKCIYIKWLKLTTYASNRLQWHERIHHQRFEFKIYSNLTKRRKRRKEGCVWNPPDIHPHMTQTYCQFNLKSTVQLCQCNSILEVQCQFNWMNFLCLSVEAQFSVSSTIKSVHVKVAVEINVICPSCRDCQFN